MEQVNNDITKDNEKEPSDETTAEPTHFNYNTEDMFSCAEVTENVPVDLLALYHSFGYECEKRSNLHLLSTHHVIFSAGAMFVILDLKTGEQQRVRTLGGGGIGAITIHPSHKYFAVGEKSVRNPYIVVYEYPSLNIYRILREGTEHAYANLDFAPSGTKLASIGSSPDYMLTIWKWEEEKIILRSKAYAQDVYKVAFSLEDEGHLCSSGTGHIKFWMMANTFTGLKLQGDLGRFGTTELTDISGFVELPDGKVLSGTEWGNMLLWDGGLIKVEIARKGKRTCHSGNIEQFFLDEGELITIGIDGYVKVWDFETIDVADAVDESKMFEVEPMSELKVGNDVKLKSLVKPSDDEETFWLAQDASGSIWKLDLTFSHTSQAPVKLFSYHAGKVTAVCTSPKAHVAVTTGLDGNVRVYDYLQKKVLCEQKFSSSGRSALWLPKTVDPDGTSFFVGFADGVVRRLAITEIPATRTRPATVTLQLLEVVKPHLAPVTCMAIDTQDKFLATASEEGNVFYFAIGKTLTMVGFVKVDTAVVSLQWSPISMGNQLLVTGRDGRVLELKKPDQKNDTSKTFEIPLQTMLFNSFEFQSVKDELLRKEREEQKAKDLAEKARLKEEERKRRKDQGLEDLEDEDDEDEDEEEEEEFTNHEQGNILKGFYKSEKGKFMLSLDGWDVGYFYECSFTRDRSKHSMELVRAIEIPQINDVAVTSSLFTKSGDYFIAGLANGAVRVSDMRAGSFDRASAYWQLAAHDNQHGAVTDVALSHDQQFLLTVGEDGNIFAYSFHDVKKVQETLSQKKSKLRMLPPLTEPVEDIKDGAHYSIEVEKQKAEHDKLMQVAQEKKEGIRNTIASLRKKFKVLKLRNEQLPPYLQLKVEEFVIDPQMRANEEKITQEKIEFLDKEMAWEFRKCEIGLQKLNKKFKESIESERVTVYAFLSQNTVSSYRVNTLAENFYLLVSENQRRMTQRQIDVLALNSRKLSVGVKGVRNGCITEEHNTADDLESKQQPAQKLDKKVAKMIEKADGRKQKRLARQKEWEEFYKSQPDENYEDPVDLQRIELAEYTIGDFKLKTASDYVVPDNQRVNAEKKRAQLLHLKEKIHDIKESFNSEVLKLRDEKIALVKEITCLINEMEKTQEQLVNQISLPEVPKIRDEEIPEKKYEYTMERLITFRKDILGMDSGVEITTEIKDERNISNQSEKPTLSSHLQTSTLGDNRLSTTMSVLSALSNSVLNHAEVEEQGEMTQMEIEIEKEKTIRLTHHRNELLHEINEKLLSFDHDHQQLRKFQFKLDVKLKVAELREITLFEELVLLKDFEKREFELAHKVNIKYNNKEESTQQVEMSRMALTAKREEVERLQEREKSLLQTFANTVGESNKFEAFLTKVFKKKIKRTKKQASDIDVTHSQEEEESSDEESDDDYDSEGDGGSEIDLDDSVCPQGCDQAIFDQVCQLRERKLDLEELLVESKKVSESLRKELDAHIKKGKVIETALKNAEEDLESFQREKQQTLNELDVLVTLRLNQIQYLQNKVLPQDLSQCLVFEQESLGKLQQRIKELEKEKLKEKTLFKERRQQYANMLRDKKGLETKCATLQEKVDQMQMLKFGKLVDLDKLETVSVNRVAEELKEKLRLHEVKNAKELAEIDRSIDSHQSELTKVIRENTKLLDSYTVFHQQNKLYEQYLDGKQKGLGGEFRGNQKTDMEERRRLIQMVQIQARDIETLKGEIGVLSRKGGYILPPPVSAPTHPATNNSNQ